MKKLVALSFVLFCTVLLYAEGAKEFLNNPLDSINPCGLVLRSGASGLGSIMNCSEFKRIYIHISNPANEKIDVGFKNSSGYNVYYRIFNPNGTIFVAGTLIPTAGSVAGRIPFFRQNIQGPSNTLGTGGYVPKVYSPAVAGNYWIEFNEGNNFTSVGTTNYELELWDISVVNTSASPFSPIKGRVYCKTWNLHTGVAIGMKALTYVYTKDSLIHKINFNGLAGNYWTMSMNSFGITNTGTIANNRKSIIGDASLLDTLGEYFLFFNLPDTTYFKLTNTPVSLTFDIAILSNCISASLGTSQCINVTSNKSGTIDLLLNFNGVAGYQPGTSDVLINTTVVQGSNCIPWNGMNGLGNYIPPGTTIPLSASLQAGLTHIPLYDVEENSPGFIVQCILPAIFANTPLLYYDDINLGYPANLGGCVSPCHSWLYTPPTTLGDHNTVNTWFYSNYSFTSTFVVGPAYIPEFTLIKTDPDCQSNFTNGTITYTALSPYTFQATDSIGIYQAPLTAPASYQAITLPHTFSNLIPGTYIISAKNTFGCSFTSTITLTSSGLVTPAVAGPNQALCAPTTSTTMAGNTAVIGTGHWTQVSGPLGAVITNSLSPTTTITGLTVGAFVFQWSIANPIGSCPPSVSTVTVTVSAANTIANAGVNQTVCVPINSITMAANIPTVGTGRWTQTSGPLGALITNTLSPTTTITSLVAGVYIFQWTISNSANNCPPSVSTVTITCLSSNTPANAGPNQTICFPANTVTMAANTPVIGIGAWTQVSGASGAVLTNTASPTTTISGLAVGTYIYQWQISNPGGSCPPSVSTVTVTIHPQPTVAINGNAVICAGQSTTLTASGGTSYQWSGGSTSTVNPLTISLNATTTYSVTTSDGFCTSLPVSVTVTVNPVPVIAVTGTNSICRGNSTVLTVTGAASYQWTGSLVSTNATVTVTPVVPTVYNVTGTTNNCSASTTYNVRVDTVPVLLVSPPASVCYGHSVILSASGALNYQWSGGSTATTHSITVAPLASTTYTVIGNNGACIGTPVSTSVTVNPNPVAHITTPFTITLYNDPFVITNLEQGGDNCMLYFGNGDSYLGCNWTTTSYTYPQDGNYTITQIVSNLFGCADTAKIDVIVDTEAGLYVPTAITVNGNGLNDVFLAKGFGITDFRMMIFDRWGEKLFESNDINKGWDGSYKGELVKQDVYIWKINYSTIKEENQQRLGTVTVVR